VNLTTTITLPLSPSSSNTAVWNYQNLSFFPIDNQLFGNEGDPHNYHFTAEVVTSFRYQGGETFTFTGDDDVGCSSTAGWPSIWAASTRLKARPWIWTARLPPSA